VRMAGSFSFCVAKVLRSAGKFCVGSDRLTIYVGGIRTKF
jgi:hypothetical protein